MGVWDICVGAMVRVEAEVAVGWVVFVAVCAGVAVGSEVGGGVGTGGD